MASLNIGAVVIVNEAQEPVGIFTERDVLRRVVLARADLHTPIAVFMTPHPVQLPSDAPAYEAALAMGQSLWPRRCARACLISCAHGPPASGRWRETLSR